MDTYANQQISNKGQPYTDFFAKHGWEKTCNYVSWAYIESVDLNDATETATPLDSLYTLCQAIGKNAATTLNTKVEGTTGGITSNDLRQNLQERMLFWMDKAKMTMTPAQKASIKAHPLKTTTGSEDPRYIAFTTSEAHIEMFAQSLSQDPAFLAMLPLPPSSTIVIEFAKATAGSNDLTASLYINDVEVQMAQCANALTCPVATYQENMAKSVTLTNVT